MQRRKYSDEFKLEAVRMCQEPGVTQAQVGKDLGISIGVLGRWVRDQKQAGQDASPGQGNPRDQEMAKLRRELARVKKERDFLRDAAAFFAKEPK